NSICKISIDFIFTRQEIKQEKQLRKFYMAINKTLNFDEIVKIFRDAIKGNVNTQCAYICMVDHDYGTYRLYAATDPLAKESIVLTEHNPIVEWLKFNDGCLFYKDFQKMTLYKSMWEIEKKNFSLLGTEFFLPLKHKDKLWGIVLLVNKYKKKPYTKNELSFLETISHIAAIAVENAYLYETIQKEAIMDSLTQVYNRKYFANKLDEEFLKAEQKEIPLSLVLINIDDFKLYQDFFQGNDLYKDYYASELNFPVLYVWQNFHSVQNLIGESFVIIKTAKGDVFAPPLAKTKNDFILAINEIKDYCRKINIAPKIICLNEKLKNFILENFDCIEPQLERGLSEYIYNVNDLINFEGKKYHAKKNHLNQFEKYNYSVKKYDESQYNSIKEILQIWGCTHQNTEEEIDAINLSLKNYERLNLICELIYVEEKIAGFAVGCVCNNDLGMILFEKADINYKGIYVKINNSFVINNFLNLRYVSLQEDMGDEGLRKSKMSYHPAFLEHKYTITLK
ncbi:MAG: phosphatidylglycerol lysyltransferase domain-containing protein, partial [Firmicutes bacterium]|nr:phosphatidylglycerol lysyltransferase domain-containing protein [Bacillota bacterium]